MSSVLAVDIGGTKMAAAIVDEEGAILQRGHTPTLGTGEPEELFRSLTELIDGVVANSSIDPSSLEVCGVGSGGPMSLGGESVSPLNIPAWREFPLRRRLAEHTGIAVHVDNDAKALALGEGWLGGARGEKNYLAMVVSTGVGAGLVVDGRLLDGAMGNAGHLGHIVVVPGGAECVCGARGCLEAEASGTGIAKAIGKPAARADLVTRRRTGMLVGRAVASAVVLLDIRLALVAGSVAFGFGEDFFSAAQAQLDADARIGYALGAKIRPAGLGGDGPLIGAAAVGMAGIGAL